MNQYFFIAQVFNLLSYAQSNFLFLRILFLGSAFFYIVFAATLDVVVLDMILFNIVFLLINVWMAIGLFVELIPPKLTKEEEDMYYSYFSKYMTKQQMKLLFSVSSRQVYTVSSTLIKPGNGFNSMYFIHKIPSNCRAIVTQQGEYEQKENCWVGILEFLDLISENSKITKDTLQNTKCFWKLKLRFEIDTNQKASNENFLDRRNSNASYAEEFNLPLLGKKGRPQDTMALLIEPLKLEEESMIVYEFDLVKMFQIFHNHSSGASIMKILYSMWLELCSHFVKQKNEINVSAIKKEKKTTGTLKLRNYSAFGDELDNLVEAD